MTSPGSTGKTRRQNSNRHRRRIPCLRDQRWGARCKAKQRSYYWRLLILRVSYTTSTPPTDKQLTSNFTWSCDVCVNQFAENDRKNGRRATGTCTTTIRPHTLHILCSGFWLNTTSLSCSSRHTHQISHYGEFFLFPRLKKVLKGNQFEATEDIKRNSTKTLLDIPKEEFGKCFQQWQKRLAKCVAAEGYYVEDN